MLYNQPFGITDPNAPYINGNPNTGTMGSIPPALSIEHPQREIVKVIQWAYDHGYTDMTGALCEAPTTALTDQLLKALFGVMNSRSLRAPQTYYVNGATGDDYINDGSVGKPFKTIQKALTTATSWNQSGWPVYISVADGIYPGINLPQLNGSGGCVLIGSGTSTCTISGVNQSAIQSGAISSAYTIQGFALTCSGTYPPGDHGCGIMLYGGTVTITNVRFLHCGESHMMTISDGWLIPINDIEIAGSAGAHITALWNSHYTHASPPSEPVLTISQPVAFNYFAISDSGSLMTCYYANIIGASNVTSAKKYLVTLNSVMYTGGGINYLPGTAPGEVLTGGQYT